MDLRTYRAKSLPEALRLVRAELGDDAAVLHTREVELRLVAMVRQNRDRSHCFGWKLKSPVDCR